MELDPRKWNKVRWEESNTVPCEPGCYALLDAKENILYIGRSKLLGRRVHPPYKHNGFVKAKDKYESLMIAWQCGWELYDAEKSIIRKWDPPFCVDK